ncbi:hypothetical protein KQI88_08780 [Alkaliphilus sp. MSJ-5]|uniref:DUF4430 domain-containing protein n=1 Tax=Alkaliphilus flagellatus TaxID=2841507 RepID=A0ABS6G220_9FIRM|nr:hypothetical protein [Alkaliphilus flagellatus]MBU5676510.1 hypothetical protein [Alkaliphilus flagellatus]
MKKLLFLLCIILFLAFGIGCVRNENPDNVVPDNNVVPGKTPNITEETLTGSASIIEKYKEIEYAEAYVENNKLILYLIPINKDVPKERVREIGISFLKALSGYTVNEGLKGPTDESYGEIYDYYNVEILVEGENGTIIDKGTKSKGKNEIKWQ